MGFEAVTGANNMSGSVSFFKETKVGDASNGEAEKRMHNLCNVGITWPIAALCEKGNSC